MLDVIRTFWPIVFALVGLIGGWWFTTTTKQSRLEWRLDQVEIKIKAMEKRHEDLSAKQSVNDVNMQVIEVSLKQIKDVLTEIRQDLRGKVDKE